MAKTGIAQLKNWFKNGLKPAQEHFWNWMDSFWHKDEAIPTESIDGLDEYFNGVAIEIGTTAKKDASNLESGDIIEWKQKLGVPEEVSTDDENVAVTSTAFTVLETDTNQKELNEEIDLILAGINSELTNKLSTPDSVEGLYGVRVTEEDSGFAYSFEPLIATNVRDMIIDVTVPYDGIDPDTMFYGWRQPDYAIKILKITAMLNTAPAGAEMKISISKNGTFVGVNEPFLVIGRGQTHSTNIHDIVGTTINPWDRIEFYTDQVGTVASGDGLQIYVQYEILAEEV